MGTKLTQMLRSAPFRPEREPTLGVPRLATTGGRATMRQVWGATQRGPRTGRRAPERQAWGPTSGGARSPQKSARRVYFKRQNLRLTRSQPGFPDVRGPRGLRLSSPPQGAVRLHFDGYENLRQGSQVHPDRLPCLTSANMGANIRVARCIPTGCCPPCEQVWRPTLGGTKFTSTRMGTNFWPTPPQRAAKLPVASMGATLWALGLTHQAARLT